MAARARILSPTVALRRNAVYKGLLGGSRLWMAVGAAVWAPRFFKRVLGRVPEFVAREVLEQCFFLFVSNLLLWFASD